MERVISSASLQLIDRSIVNSRFNLDRDIGLQLHHKFKLGEKFVIKEKLAFSQGEGRNITSGSQGGMEYTGRLELLPFGEFLEKGDYFQADLEREPSPKLMLGAVYDINNDAVRTRSNLGSFMLLEDGTLYETDIQTFFLDAVFKYRGLSVMAEYAYRDAEDPIARIQGENQAAEYRVLEGQGINFQTAYLFKSNYEIAARYSRNDYSDIIEVDDVEQYTLGGSKYIVGHKLKVQADINYSKKAGIEDFISFRTGFEFHF